MNFIAGKDFSRQGQAAEGAKAKQPGWQLRLPLRHHRPTLVMVAR
jgi:hypothetical protein